jgi:ABC-type phosphate transport system substrate-binding protein
MSAFKQSMRKLGVRAGLLAGTSAAVLAIAGIGAGSAMAAPTCPTGTIAGEGSSLQKIAQLEVWNPDYNSICSGKTSVSYKSSSSGAGLEAFRYNGAGSINTGLEFIGSDDGPNTTQIANAEAASGTPAVIVPVTQTAIAVVIHPPSGCEFNPGTGITYNELNEVFGGEGIVNWDEFENINSLSACNQAITRVVRAEGSGTTVQFKNYLGTLEEEQGTPGVPCIIDGTTKWKGLREVGSGNKPNIDWPSCTAGATPIVTAAGGGAVAETVANAANVGYIGYAALPDAKSKGAAVANLQNGNLFGATFAEPGEAGVANCGNARYTVAAGSETVGTSRDWSQVFGAQPEIEGFEYPLCTLTYDAGWNQYSKITGYTEAQANAAKDYLGNYVTAGGQSDLAAAGKWYAPLPTGGGVGSGSDVRKSAETAAAALAF